MKVIRSGIGLAPSQLVGDSADGDEVARAKQDDRLLLADPGAASRLLEDLADGAGARPFEQAGHQTAAVAATKRSSGTSSSSPTSRASSRKV